MKKILLFIIISSFVFPGMLYFEFGLSPKYTLNIYEFDPDIELDMNKGGFTIGYNRSFYQKGKFACAIGGSYMILPMRLDEVGGISLSDGLDAGFLSLYLLPTYSLGEKLSAWASIGFNKPFYDLDIPGIKNGMTLGYGIHIKINDKYGIGAGFTENRLSHDNADLKFHRTSLFLTTMLNK